MYTSIVLVALTGMAAAPVGTANDAVWKTDYAAAYAQGHKEQKPLALVFGNGKEGVNSLCKEGKLDQDVLDAMQSGYVPVYIDLDQDAGKKLAGSFKVTAGPALVLTDRDVDLIALRQTGAVAKADLMKGLKKYGNPERVVQMTETDINAEIRYYPPATTAPVTTSYQPASAPVMMQGIGGSYAPAYTPGFAPSYAPSYAPAFAPSFGGGCPGGRCR